MGSELFWQSRQIQLLLLVIGVKGRYPMGDVSKSADLGDALSEVVVVTFDLVGDTARGLPTMLTTSLQSKDVQDAIRTGLMAFTQKKFASGSEEVTPEEAEELLKLGSSVGGKVVDNLTGQIKRGPEYQRLEKKLKAVGELVKSSPLGVWVDRNAGIVYVVGIGVAISAAAALYLTKTGGPVVQLPISLLKDKPVQFFKVGKFKLSGGLLKFEPDIQSVGGTLIASQQWTRIETTFKIGVIATGKDVQEIRGQAVVKSSEFSITADARAEVPEKKVNLSLGFGFKSRSLPGPLNISVGAIITDGSATGGNLNASLETKAGIFGMDARTDSRETRALATFTIPW